MFEFNIEHSKRMLDYTVIEYNALVSFWYLDQQNRWPSERIPENLTKFKLYAQTLVVAQYFL